MPNKAELPGSLLQHSKIITKMSARVPLCDRPSLDAMHTGSLLARLQRLRQCEDDFARSDRHGAEPDPDPLVTGYIEFKNSPHWNEAYQDLKETLADREHLLTAEERKTKRRKGN